MAGPSQPELSQRAQEMYALVIGELSGRKVSDLEEKLTGTFLKADIDTIQKEFPYDSQRGYIPGLRSLINTSVLGGSLVERGFGSGTYEIKGALGTREAAESLSPLEVDYLKRSAQKLLD